jgi:prepilin-type N-terminal cleavage/methylation domain-containing protein
MGRGKLKGGNLGFTLLELLLVLTILAGSGFILLAKISLQSQNRNLAIAGTRMLEELREARQAAMTENTWYRVNFYPDNNSYRVINSAELVKEVFLPAGVKFLGYPNPDHVVFNALGMPAQGTTVRLGTENGKEGRNIIIASVGGRIREEQVKYK